MCFNRVHPLFKWLQVIKTQLMSQFHMRLLGVSINSISHTFLLNRIGKEILTAVLETVNLWISAIYSIHVPCNDLQYTDCKILLVTTLLCVGLPFSTYDICVFFVYLFVNLFVYLLFQQLINTACLSSMKPLELSPLMARWTERLYLTTGYESW